jgi:hypothetical protein
MTKATDKQKNQRDNNRVIRKSIEGKIALLESVKKANGRQKYRKMTKSLFWVDSKSVKK